MSLPNLGLALQLRLEQPEPESIPLLLALWSLDGKAMWPLPVTVLVRGEEVVDVRFPDPELWRPVVRRCGLDPWTERAEQWLCGEAEREYRRVAR